MRRQIRCNFGLHLLQLTGSATCISIFALLLLASTRAACKSESASQETAVAEEQTDNAVAVDCRFRDEIYRNLSADTMQVTLQYANDCSSAALVFKPGDQAARYRIDPGGSRALTVALKPREALWVEAAGTGTSSYQFLHLERQ